MIQDDEEGTPTEEQDAPSGAEDNLALEELEAEDEVGEAFDPRAAALVVPTGARDLEAVYEIPVQVAAVLGKSHMQVSQLLKLGRGAVVELDRKVGEAIDIYVNNRLVARGEVVVVDDKLGVTMTEIIKSEKSSN
ncbi:flagellar motor switch protein FliN [Aestuariispira insulae]|uniref:Flagellar motor switch protein FliN n=1 Tax=Aestuariispira insulae TaxID=1461337 RepID=A0A3D9HSD2_9PROT|nr:flagellar motor switch protein FliN [Aestuariispira insulae]RED52423.1 flagellar motor switch protein FliN/FliY [Aestuariispira insulae]